MYEDIGGHTNCVRSVIKLNETTIVREVWIGHCVYGFNQQYLSGVEDILIVLFRHKTERNDY